MVLRKVTAVVGVLHKLTQFYKSLSKRSYVLKVSRIFGNASHHWYLQNHQVKYLDFVGDDVIILEYSV